MNISLHNQYQPNLNGLNFDQEKITDGPAREKDWQTVERSVQYLKDIDTVMGSQDFDPDNNFIAQNEEAYDLTYKAQQTIRKLRQSKDLTPALKAAAERIERVVLSLRLGLGISADDLEAFPGYEAFIKANHWHYKATRYNQVFTMTDEGHPSVLFNDRMIPFRKLLKKKHTEGTFKGLPVVNPRTMRLNGASIIQKGVILKPQKNATHLFSHETVDPSEYDNEYVFQINTSLKDLEEAKQVKGEEGQVKPRFTGDHCWIELKKPNGKVYSWGVVRPAITPFQGVLQGSKMMLNGAAVVPDEYTSLEKKENNVLSTEFKISKEQHKAIKGQINKMNKEGIPFCAITGLTCQGHAVHFASKLGIKAEGEMTVATFVGKNLFSKSIIRFYQKFVPGFIRAAFTYIADFFLGVVLRLFGQIHAKESKVSQLFGTEYDGFLPSFWNIFQPVVVQHPVSMREWQRKVEAYRASEDGQKAGRFALPPQFQLPATI
ncbi:hypothetical protein [Criblamydia sequanensis]|uniref:Conserved putative membrane protein n=1 Tax=Candidatus Criblamydia sequanensis CRIB-18 TaxID=1437425 RepID=A0A090CYW9_9BACT|nr:hypothetical protein [Criblamydia sequanensis]CDR33791.1 Conserved putative membrane protein [Criblamydia sequanensis CRIB-18]